MEIRKTRDSEKIRILDVHEKAFGGAKGQEIAELVDNMLGDDTGEPMLSLVALEGDRFIGHILFSKATIAEAGRSISAHILAPLAVLPEVQGQGAGEKLIRAGLAELKAMDVELVFVLGHPTYYPRCGFAPAGALGFDAPYSIPDEHAGAWMVQALQEGVVGTVGGTVQCSDVLNQPQHWRE